MAAQGEEVDQLRAKNKIRCAKLESVPNKSRGMKMGPKDRVETKTLQGPIWMGYNG